MILLLQNGHMAGRATTLSFDRDSNIIVFLCFACVYRQRRSAGWLNLRFMQHRCTNQGTDWWAEGGALRSAADCRPACSMPSPRSGRRRPHTRGRARPTSSRTPGPRSLRARESAKRLAPECTTTSERERCAIRTCVLSRPTTGRTVARVRHECSKGAGTCMCCCAHPFDRPKTAVLEGGPGATLYVAGSLTEGIVALDLGSQWSACLAVRQSARW